MIVKVILQQEDGGQKFITNKQDIDKFKYCIPSEIKWEQTANIKTLSNKYFAMLSELQKNTETGYTKSDLHNALKPLILNPLFDISQYFKDGEAKLSTRCLSYEGWIAVIEQLKLTANDIFGYIFK